MDKFIVIGFIIDGRARYRWKDEVPEICKRRKCSLG